MIRLILPVVLAALLGGCEQHPQAKYQTTKTFDQKRHEQGREIYNFRCYYCHGYSGDAKTLAASYTTPRPLNFTTASPDKITRERMLKSITEGRPHTAMKGFGNILTQDEIAAVADFVRHEFMYNKKENTRYHTAANGWPNHERYIDAYPFAKGEIALDTPWDQLNERQANGKRFFLTSCVSCHDNVKSGKQMWETRPISFPRNQHEPGDHPPPFIPGKEQAKVDATTSASPYKLHDIAPKIANLTALEKKGETLFQQNCAFCHAADGTAKNWIGSFMEPHPRNLTDAAAMKNVTSRARLKTVIREGLPNTSMPAWKNILDDEQINAVVAYVAKAFHPMPE